LPFEFASAIVFSQELKLVKLSSNKYPDFPNSVRVGILQFIPQLDDAVWGFMQELESRLGYRPRFELLEAEGKEKKCPALAQRLVERNCQLMFGCLTPAAKALMHAAKHNRTPVVFAPVFHPVLSGLVKDEQLPGGHVTGVTGRLDPRLKIEKINLLFPSLKEVTIIARGGDELSLWEAHSLAGAFKERGMNVQIDEVLSGYPQPTNHGRVHFLAFSPELEETMEEWIKAFYYARAPVIGSSARAGSLGAVMAVFADHGDLGRIAGEMAAEILKDCLPSRMPVRQPPGVSYGFNYYAAGKLGIRIPPRLGQSVDIL
jgi:putative ABC transport system substrate-binding protein